MLDHTDIEILDALLTDARISWVDLGARIKLSGPATAERVKRLEAKGVIKEFRTEICPDALGLRILAYVSVTLENVKYRESFLKGINALPQVLEAQFIAGNDDYLLKVRALNPQSLDDLLNSGIKAIEGVATTRTVVALSTAKNVPVSVGTAGERNVLR